MSTMQTVPSFAKQRHAGSLAVKSGVKAGEGGTTAKHSSSAVPADNVEGGSSAKHT